MRAGAEPEGYNLSYSFLLTFFFCFNLRKKRWSEASRFKVRSSLSFSNLDLSEIISWNYFGNYFINYYYIKSNLIKNAYLPFLIDKFIKKYLDHNFSSNQNQLTLSRRRPVSYRNQSIDLDNQWTDFYLISASVVKELKDKSDFHYFKLPYIGNLSHHIKNKLSKLCKEFC